MHRLPRLLSNNRAWAEEIQRRDPTFFPTLSRQQKPDYLWIGCSDSRVPANQIVGLLPGELFVHRNVANMVYHADLNCLSVLQYAIEALGIDHVIVCGHYGCGGVRAAVTAKELGLIDNWLRPIRVLAQRYEPLLSNILEPEERINRLCELNVIEQVYNVCQTTVVQRAWERGKMAAIHGWIYGVHDGLLRDLHVTITAAAEISVRYSQAVQAL